MSKSSTFMTAMPVSMLMAAAMASTPSAEGINRSSWMPNVGALNEGEQPLGDLWTFNCPHNGTFSVSVDTKDDTDGGQATTDPVLLVVDGAGNLIAFADDDTDCSYPPICNFACPSVTRQACGQGGSNSVVVRDYGVSGCTGGGGYELALEVFNASGQQLPASGVKLGGGPNRRVPKWAVSLGKAPVGPALDDEDVPHGSEFFDSNALAGNTIRRVSPQSLIKK